MTDFPIDAEKTSKAAPAPFSKASTPFVPSDKPRAGWQPIETAPRDGSTFVTFSPARREGAIDLFDFAVYEDGEFCKYGCGFQFATHWFALPPAPEAGA